MNIKALKIINGQRDLPPKGFEITVDEFSNENDTFEDRDFHVESEEAAIVLLDILYEMSEGEWDHDKVFEKIRSNIHLLRNVEGEYGTLADEDCPDTVLQNLIGHDECGYNCFCHVNGVSIVWHDGDGGVFEVEIQEYLARSKL